jgi:glycosyltransferase involved in cell wall biosynthesis
VTGDAPLVSLAMPVFNGERYLEETLASLFDQDFTDFELIISDNGSTDRTPAICQDAAVRDDRIRFHRHDENHGAAWNYNHLVTLARGRYFKWCGHDDLCAPSYLDRCVEALETSGSSAVLAYPRTVLIDGAGETIRSYDDGLDLRQASARARLRALLRNLGLANAVFGLVRTDVLATTGVIGAYNRSDLVLLCELALRGQVLEIPDELFSRRIHPDASHRANPTARQAREWFTGRPAGGPVLPRTRFIAEIVRAIVRAPLAPEERVACLGVLTWTWGPRYTKLIAAELIRAVPDAVRSVATRRLAPRTT